MNAIVMMTSGVARFAAAAVPALLLAFHKTLSGVIAGIGGAVGSLMTLAAGGVVLIDGQSVDTLIPLIHHAVELTPLNAIWLITFGLCGLFISLFNIDWHRHQHTKANGLLVNLLMAAAVCTVVASNLGALVVMAEIMALCGVFLTGCSASGKLWFALGRLGTLLLALACWLVWQRFGTLDFAALNGQPLGNDVWLLSVVGFGLLAGIIPLHGWVPQAHANASAPAAALFSTVVMKVGLFGILTITLTGDQPPLWWGVALLIAGMITAFVGGLYALMEHNIQRLLAYHTTENIGIILLGMGAGVTGLALNQPALIAAGFIGGLYHLINHSLFKSTLFLGAGSVWFRTGHRDIEKLGGIGKNARHFAGDAGRADGDGCAAAAERLCRRVGDLSILLRPRPERGVYRAFTRPAAGGGPAITGALAVMCMAKVYGVTFPGAPRTREAENACCAPVLMTTSVVALALCCIAGGVAAPWLLPQLGHAIPLPLVTAHSVVSQPMMALLLIAAPLLPFVLMLFFRRDRLASRSRGAAWACGYEHEQSMVITAHGFAMPVKENFAAVLKLRHWLNPVGWVPGWQGPPCPYCSAARR